jgi:hypothetical protein
MIELLQSIVQIAAIIVGWIVVHRLSASRDIDKARREMVAKTADAMSEELSRLLLSAKDYHIKERDVASEESLKLILQDQAIRVSLLSDISNDYKELAALRGSVLALRRAITAKHFEDEHTSPLNANDNQIQVIAESVLKFKQCLVRLKNRQFPVS